MSQPVDPTGLQCSWCGRVPWRRNRRTWALLVGGSLGLVAVAALLTGLFMVLVSPWVLAAVPFAPAVLVPALAPAGLVFLWAVLVAMCLRCDECGRTEMSYRPEPAPEKGRNPYREAGRETGPSTPTIDPWAAPTLGRLPRPAARLIVVEGKDSGRELPLFGDPVSVGRESKSDLSLDDIGVSRRHFSVRQGPAGFELTDLCSSNGTLIDGEHVRGPILLQDGDEITAGNTLLRFQCSAAAPVRSRKKTPSWPPPGGWCGVRGSG